MNDLEEIAQAKHLKKGAVGCIKGLIAAIPYVGSAMVGAWDGYWNSRAEDTITGLSQAIRKLDEEKIDLEYVESEEFFDLFSYGLRVRSQSRSKVKAKFILGLFTESMRKSRDARFSTSLKESFLHILEWLTDGEMEFLHHFSEGQYNQKSKNDIYQIGDDSQGIAMDGLFAKGILREDDTWSKYINESMLGREFIAYLKLLAREESQS